MSNTTKTMKAKFYTDSNRYKGYSEVNDSTYFELRSWILSGNYLIIDDERVSTVKELNKMQAGIKSPF